MPTQEPISPALLLFHEKGDLLFSNPEATRVTGFSALEMRRLSDCLGHLFPLEADLAVVSGILRRALATGNGAPEPVHFISDFATRTGARRRGSFHIEIYREGYSGRRLVLCLVPCPALAPRPEPMREEGTSDQVEELLDDAIGCILAIQREGCSQDRLDILVRKIARSRCLLGGTTGLDRVWGTRPPKADKGAVPPRIKVLETKVDS